MDFGRTYEESRRTRTSLYRELSLRQRALRETRVRGIQEVEDVKRIQTRQIDELFRNPVPEDGDGAKSAIPNSKCPKSSATGNSFDALKERSFTNYGVDQQRLQIPEPHFDKFPTPQTFQCWKIRFKTQVCSCSNCRTEAML